MARGPFAWVAFAGGAVGGVLDGKGLAASLGVTFLAGVGFGGAAGFCVVGSSVIAFGAPGGGGLLGLVGAGLLGIGAALDGGPWSLAGGTACGMGKGGLI